MTEVDRRLILENNFLLAAIRDRRDSRRERNCRLPQAGSVADLAKGGLGVLLSVFLVPALAVAAEPASDDNLQQAGALLRAAATERCPAAFLDPQGVEDQTPGPLKGYLAAAVNDRGPADAWVRREVILEKAGSDLSISLSATRAGGALRRISLTALDEAGKRPLMTALADGTCLIHHGRALQYDAAGDASTLIHLAPDLAQVETTEPLNPPVPAGDDPGGVTVAHIDSGVNYLLPEITKRLARDQEGKALGQDFWDLDDRPFDGDTGRSPFFPIRHGTPVASLLVAEAPDIRLVPYRYPRPDMTRMGEIVSAAAAAGAGIVALPMGSRQPGDWESFAAAAKRYSNLLFIVSAGNDGRDIDADPLYPASLTLENMIVVTSSDAFGRLARGSNWGPLSVDLMVPAEQLEVIDYRGARGQASGSSYAVPRVAALAARLKAAHPDWQAAELKRAILARAVTPLQRGAARVAAGWIPNPADDD
ncbi:S8 family serine peptidase [Pelagibius litoralis]|uniref:S8 family serine peptidase n=1 Tax=Pelagibius litoralis TaxID=374515 RepID=A0A967KG04_9PROT|nr:S8 family serine peptidase [Pelagibius litoralis]NIA69961.1 S8 family serine peptidase [Pelagibius litoralis]